MKNIKLVHDRRDEWEQGHFELWAAELRARETHLTSAAWVGWHEEEEDPA
ncbi:hypothetical protein J2790_002707 [Paenarthrobacter nicotinovorans]|nr:MULTISPECIES: hypothetical protein [Micrococcaceae]MDR6437558.1 hypothetical protein [Paenarthrobacter nicotinovorans]SCZ60718.1 hypothetical protein SAMN02799638_02993 [Arthrobacter sp. UNCCL28]